MCVFGVTSKCRKYKQTKKIKLVKGKHLLNQMYQERE